MNYKTLYKKDFLIQPFFFNNYLINAEQSIIPTGNLFINGTHHNKYKLQISANIKIVINGSVVVFNVYVRGLFTSLLQAIMSVMSSNCSPFILCDICSVC